MQVRLFKLSPEDIEAQEAQIHDVYRQAFAAPPYNNTEEGVRGFAQTLAHHIQRDGLSFYTARDEEVDRLVGFTYGYTSHPGQWWHDTIASAMTSTMAQEWFSYTLELVELAVIPDAQGYGLGGQLHDALLRDVPHRTALLSTYDGETRGMQLYRKRGWLPLLPHYYFPGGEKPMVIMGKQLHP